MLKIAFHGGKCCAIKTIHGFSADPEKEESALEARAPGLQRYLGSDAPDRFGSEVHSSLNMFNREAPAETCIKRLDRYIEFLDEVRPNGIIEVCLAEKTTESLFLGFTQYSIWRKHLNKRGFRVVTHCYNSNSNNRVYVFHRKTDREKV